MTTTVLLAFEAHYLPQHPDLSKGAASSCRTNLRRFQKLTDNPAIDLITSETFDSFRKAAKGANYSPDSIEASVNAVLSVLRACADPKLGVLPAVPEPGRALKISTRVKYMPPLTDLGRLYSVAWRAKWPRFCDPTEFWQAAFVVDLWTALRKGDLFFRLEWDSITDESIVVTAHKTEKTHTLPNSPIVERHLRPLRRLDSKRVFPIGDCHHQILRELNRLADAAGVKRFGFQAIRRRSCTNWQSARWGAGEVVQGSAIKGSACRYIVPDILQQAAPRFQWPAEMLTADERDQAKQEEQRLMNAVRRMGGAERAAVLSLAEKLVT